MGIVAASDEACKVACRGDPNCQSFVYCPGWGKCWMKDRQLNGTESTGPQSDCRTYYETEFCSATDAPAAESSPAREAVAKPHSDASATCEAQWDNMACSAWGECYTCGARISYLVDTVGLSRAGAGQQISDEFEEACGACGGSCFGEFPQVVSEQGGGVGGEIVAASDEACKVACRGDPNCKSFVYCPGWGKCWMKDRQLNGTESTGPQSDCRTYYETEFCSTTAAPAAESSPAREAVAKRSGTTWHAQHGASATHVVPASPTLSTLSVC